MWLSDISVKRPVFAAVLNFLIIAFGIISFSNLTLREYPDIELPIISIETSYQGASASVIESKITKIIEERIASVEGIKSIDSQSEDGVSNIIIEFRSDRNIDIAAADIRDKISGILGRLPKEIEAPEISKSKLGDDMIMWLHLNGDGMSTMELTDYAWMHINDHFSAINGVARVRIAGAQYKSLRVWIDPRQLAARNLTVGDIENALMKDNIELPAGAIESKNIYFTVKVNKSYKSLQDFKNLILTQGDNGYFIKLSDVARVEIAPEENRNMFRSNGSPVVALGIVKQSRGNILDIARNIKKEVKKLNKNFPPDLKLSIAYDASVFVESAVKEVYHTLSIALVLVVLVIFAFLGNLRAMIIPALMIPISLIGSFIILLLMGYTINLLTLLALVLSIGLVVDDAIVVIENIHRRIDELGEPPLLAAYRGSRQVGFAIIATTLVLIVVFVPLMFLEGPVGRLLSEFSIVMATTIILSGFAALTATPMLASKLLKPTSSKPNFTKFVDKSFNRLKNFYLIKLLTAFRYPKVTLGIFFIMLGISGILLKILPSEFSPKQDKGTFAISIRGPEGASYNYMLEYVQEVEKKLLPYVNNGDFTSLLLRVPGSFYSSAYNSARGSIVLKDWSSGRNSVFYYADQVRKATKNISGIKISTNFNQAFGQFEGKPIQFVIGGPSYEKLAEWQNIFLAKAELNPGLVGLESDYFASKPQIGITINRDNAAALGVRISEINSTLETLLGSKKITTYEDNGQEYDIILESEKNLKNTPTNINNIYVRSYQTDKLIPLSNLITISNFADVTSLNRYNRIRSVTFEANLAPGYTLDEALKYMRNLVRSELPKEATINYKGDSLNYIESNNSIYWIFIITIIIVFLVLAAQFESFIHPFIIMFTVPLATFGALAALWVGNQTLNIYSQIGLIILIGIATKNGILIVEFANQLRDQKFSFKKAILLASSKRLRPIIITTLTTSIGALPLIIGMGPGQESRTSIGIVIFFGVITAAFFTIFIIPVVYYLLTKNITSPNYNEDSLKLEDQIHPNKV